MECVKGIFKVKHDNSPTVFIQEFNNKYLIFIKYWRKKLSTEPIALFKKQQILFITYIINC